MPERIQRLRVKGWRLPDGAVFVARPSIFASPFGGFTARDRRRATDAFAEWVEADELDPSQWTADLIGWHTRLKAGLRSRELVGRDLACWCPLDHPCHADVLLEVADDYI